MPAYDEHGLTPGERSAIGAALGRDPALGAELELILPVLDAAAGTTFLRELAAASPGAERPAAAVLEALVAAAHDRRP
ncbi:MAG: hypothetical protein R2718_02140 [Solirubrobacterales bacterium]|nr:hypothetical protein [Solirubrobacterales bacterium]